MPQSQLINEMSQATKNSIGTIKSLVFPEDDGAKKEQTGQTDSNDCKRRRGSASKPCNQDCGAIGENADGEQRRVLKASEYQIYRFDEYYCPGSESCDLVVESPVREAPLRRRGLSLYAVREGIGFATPPCPKIVSMLVIGDAAEPQEREEAITLLYEYRSY